MNARLVLLVVLAMTVPTAARAQMVSVQGVVSTETPVRIDPSARVPLTTLRRGTDVTVIAVEGSWLRVSFEDLRYGTRVGYVPRTTVTFGPPGAAGAHAKPAERTVAPATASAPAFVSAPVAIATPTVSAPAAEAVPAAVAAGPAAGAAVPAAAADVAAAPAPTVPPARPPVRLVEAQFPAPEAAPALASSDAATPARQVVSIEGAFPDATVQTSTSSVLASGMSPIVPSLAAPPEAPASLPPAAASSSRSAHAGMRVIRAPVSPQRGMRVTLMIPRVLLTDDGAPVSAMASAVAADITAERDGAVVNGEADWMGAGLPSLLEATIGKITRKKEHTALELQATGPRGDRIGVTLRFAHGIPDAEAVLGQLVAQGPADAPAVHAYRNEAHATLARTAFAGDLEGLPQERKFAILAALQRGAGASDIHRQNGYTYAAFDLGVHDRLFDDRSADVEAIVAVVLRETLLPEMRRLSASLADVPELRGMRVTYRIPHRATPRSQVEFYQVEVTSDMPAVIALAADASAAPSFVDASRVVVDGDDIRLDLEALTPSATD